MSVPFSVFGTLWGYFRLEEHGMRHRAPIDWLGNITFASGLILVMIAITYGIQPYGGHVMGWTSPRVLGELGAGIVLLCLFLMVERRVPAPMFRLELLRIRAFTFGTLSSFLSALARGGLMFMLIIWLQGIWLPRHGYSFDSTPLWAGIFMLPLSVGVVLAGPISGYLSDRFGSRPFATGGMLMQALAFVLLQVLPTDFAYPAFAAVILLSGLGSGVFASPNRAGVMNSLPPEHRGAGSGMNTTFQNSAQVLSIGVFFTLMIVGLSDSLPRTLTTGLRAQGVSPAVIAHVVHLPPVSVLSSTRQSGSSRKRWTSCRRWLDEMPPVCVAKSIRNRRHSPPTSSSMRSHSLKIRTLTCGLPMHSDRMRASSSTFGQVLSAGLRM